MASKKATKKLKKGTKVQPKKNLAVSQGLLGYLRSPILAAPALAFSPSDRSRQGRDANGE
jgi:hypothetical protein